MAADTVAVKIPRELAERCDERAAAWEEHYPGVKFTRADAVRVYLERGLGAPDEIPKASKRKAKRS